ncbi:hypothetical protein [Pseudonocardia sp. N23]|uniref:hypothetical protein n=1 Tax=Pseudonocardia sp. N23 TaxID=1987376 RepID=UPI000BFC64B7|nr:hypothetical protein [Pseudonocardia sp. N23]
MPAASCLLSKPPGDEYQGEHALVELRFLFVGPAASITDEDVARLTASSPSLVVLDGVNEAMALHGQAIREEDGAAAFRAALVKPFTRAGAAVVSLDHVVKDPEKRGGYALGSIYKGNGLTRVPQLMGGSGHTPRYSPRSASGSRSGSGENTGHTFDRCSNC